MINIQTRNHDNFFQSMLNSLEARILREEILHKDSKTFLIRITCTGKEYIATGSLNGFSINETRQAVTESNRYLAPDDPEIENLYSLIRDDIMENEF